MSCPGISHWIFRLVFVLPAKASLGLSPINRATMMSHEYTSDASRSLRLYYTQRRSMDLACDTSSYRGQWAHAQLLYCDEVAGIACDIPAIMALPRVKRLAAKLLLFLLIRSFDHRCHLVPETLSECSFISFAMAMTPAPSWQP